MIPGWPTLLGAGFGGHTTTAWLSFLLFWGLNVFIIYRGMDLVREVENWAAPFVLVMTAVLLWWAVSRANGLGPLLAQPGKFHTLGEFWPVFVPSLTAMIGFWATLSLNMPDFTRFGRSQREQVVGQVVALPTTMSLFAAMGVMITSATAIIYGESIWDPVVLVGKFTSPLVVAVSMFTVIVATIAVNIAANVVSPANDFANAFPRFISFKTGGLITGILGIAIQPWKLLADPSGYIYTWLLGYSGGLGSIAGVLVADYWLVRRRQLALEDLYLPDGVYRGWNLRAIAATAIGCALAWGGVVVPALKPLYDYAWFVGFFAAGLAHLALAPRQPRGRAAAAVGSQRLTGPSRLVMYPRPQPHHGPSTARDSPGDRRNRLVHRLRPEAERLAVGDQPPDPAPRGGAWRAAVPPRRPPGPDDAGRREPRPARAARVPGRPRHGWRDHRPDARAARHAAALGRHDRLPLRLPAAAEADAATCIRSSTCA